MIASTAVTPASLVARISQRRKPLAACIAIAYALALMPPAFANVILVTTCTDNGAADTGNLRNSIATAHDMDTIDMQGLTTCVNSRITLSKGQIDTTLNNLYLQGPTALGAGVGTLTIYGAGNGQNGMLRHTGTGTLGIYNLSLSHGYIAGNAGNAQVAKGGCIYSTGSVTLGAVGVDHCFATTTSGKAYGGGIYSKQLLIANYSAISANTAIAGPGGTAVGGGIFAKAGLTLGFSTISGNTATGPSDTQGIDGGAYVLGNTNITASTISGNTAHAHVGGMFIGGAAAMSTLSIRNSTISGNSATKGPIGGVFDDAFSSTVQSSTIAFNTAGMATFGGTGNIYSPGLALVTGLAAFQSTLIANNGYGPTAIQNDLTLGTATASGANNLVRTSTAALPTGTIQAVCPLLGILRNNGRSTQTHALLSHSPGIDQGNNTFNLKEDQRGVTADIFLPTLPYPRTSGTVADIGAYEVQKNDIVFNNAFDGCP